MPNLRLCKKDPLLSVLKEHFNANLVRIPKESVKPYTVVGLRNNQLHELGDIKGLFKETIEDSSLLTVKSEKLHEELSGKRTGSMDASFGVSILEGFAKGFGIPATELGAFFKRSKNISFSFDGIRSQYLDRLKLGSFLSRKELDIDNPYLRPYLEDPKLRLFIVVRTYQGKSFNVHHDNLDNTGLNVDVDSLEEILGKADVKVDLKRNNEGAFIFDGTKYKTFAFQAVELEIDEETFFVKSVSDQSDHEVMREANLVPVTVIEEEMSEEEISKVEISFDLVSDIEEEKKEA